MEQITDLLDQNAGKGGRTSRSNPRSASNTRQNSARNSSTTIGGKISSLTRAGAGEPVANGLQIREDPKTGIFVEGLTQVHVKSKDQLL